MAVKVSGNVLASLFYDNSNCDRDQEGFLLGQIHHHKTDVISDSQINSTKEVTETYIYSHLACKGQFSWYDYTGKIVTSKLKTLLGNNRDKEVVGWYKMRRNSSNAVSLRERAVHRALAEVFPERRLLFMLCTTICTPNSSTHSFDHIVMSWTGRQFEGLPLHVVNLGATAQSHYKTTASNTVNTKKGIFAQAVQKFTSEFSDQSGTMKSVSGIRTFNATIHKQLLDLCSTVVVSERQLGEISCEVAALQQQLKSKQEQLAPPTKASASAAAAAAAEKHKGVKSPVLKARHIVENNVQKASKAPAVSPPNLIDLDLDEDSSSSSPPLKPIAVNNTVAHKTQLSTKMAANLGGNNNKSGSHLTGTQSTSDKPVASTATGGSAVKVPGLLMPQKSAHEPITSKSKSNEPGASRSGPQQQQNKAKSDKFEFVEGILKEHKQKTAAGSGGRLVHPSHSCEEKSSKKLAAASAAATERSNSVPYSNKMDTMEGKVTRSSKAHKDNTRAPANSWQPPPSNSVQVDDVDAMDYETSDSPTF